VSRASFSRIVGTCALKGSRSRPLSTGTSTWAKVLRLRRNCPQNEFGLLTKSADPDSRLKPRSRRESVPLLNCAFVDRIVTVPSPIRFTVWSGWVFFGNTGKDGPWWNEPDMFSCVMGSQTKSLTFSVSEVVVCCNRRLSFSNRFSRSGFGVDIC